MYRSARFMSSLLSISIRSSTYGYASSMRLKVGSARLAIPSSSDSERMMCKYSGGGICAGKSFRSRSNSSLRAGERSHSPHHIWGRRDVCVCVGGKPCGKM